jgi:hypothetical protein
MPTDIQVIKNMLETQKIEHHYYHDRWSVPTIKTISVPQGDKRMIFSFSHLGELYDVSVYGNIRGVPITTSCEFKPEPDRILGTHARFIDMLNKLDMAGWVCNSADDPLCCSNGDVIKIQRGWKGMSGEIEFVFGELSEIRLLETKE